MNNVIIFGGDGFCGWPTSLFLRLKRENVLTVSSKQIFNMEI